ncbi:MAG TPA: hypothetical protein VMH86_06800 [Rhizomicrobium sp.]|nr:hypothetical protein [Rhizomicrobium sp.]
MGDLRNLRDWLGRTETLQDVAAAVPLAGMNALLNRDTPVGDTVPPLGHWLYFLNGARQSELGSDGHPKRDGALPPRRMWAGSRVEFLAPIAIGAAMTRRAETVATEKKSGASGDMIFVTERYEISADGVPAVQEERDVVYRAATGEAPKSSLAMPQPEHTRSVTPDATQLFRFSALTFNAHRIHYDRDYTTGVEGYPGLVVQGPYTAMLLMDLALRQGVRPRTFAFRARRPHFAGRVLNLCAAGNRLWSTDDRGQVGMTAEIS